MVLWFFVALLVIFSIYLSAASRVGILPSSMRIPANGAVAMSLVSLGLLSWQTFAPPGAARISDLIGDTVPAAELPGAKTFATAGCTRCHTIGGGKKTGPDLSAVGQRLREREISRFIFDPEAYYRAKDIPSLNHGYPKMPTIGISEAAADDIAEFLVAKSREAGKK